jgi:hypothetical protein
MTNMLIDERPILFSPSLAKALGSCERAIVLQQIHFLLRLPNSGVWEDGYHWVWGSYEDWCKDYFMMWNWETLKHHILKLEKQGLVISARLRAHQHDQTKFYRIHYAHELLDPTRNREHVPPSNGEDVVASNRQHVPPSINRTETSTESTPKRKMRPTQAQRRNYSDIPDDDDASRRKQYTNY